MRFFPRLRLATCCQWLFAVALIVSSAAPAMSQDGSDGKARWEGILAAAKKERVINIAGPPQAAERGVIATFKKAYPDINLQYTGLTSGSFLSRVTLERQGGTYEWDVVVGGPSSLFEFIDKGFFQPLRPLVVLPDNLSDQNWLGGFDNGFQDNAGKYIYAFTAYISNQIKVNRTVVPESELNDDEQLVDPKWKGKIFFYDPRGGGAGSTVLSMLYKELGPDKVKTLLVDQAPILTTDKRQFTEWLIRGQYPIGIGVVDAYLAPFHKEGIGFDVKDLRSKIELVTTGSGTVAVLDRNPHPNATIVFVNWLLSRPVQELWAKTATTNSRRLDVPSGSPETKPDPSKMAEYLNFNHQSNNHLKVESQALARKLRP